MQQRSVLLLMLSLTVMYCLTIETSTYCSSAISSRSEYFQSAIPATMRQIVRVSTVVSLLSPRYESIVSQLLDIVDNIESDKYKRYWVDEDNLLRQTEESIQK